MVTKVHNFYFYFSQANLRRTDTRLTYSHPTHGHTHGHYEPFRRVPTRMSLNQTGPVSSFCCIYRSDLIKPNIIL